MGQLAAGGLGPMDLDTGGSASCRWTWTLVGQLDLDTGGSASCRWTWTLVGQLAAGGLGHWWVS